MTIWLKLARWLGGEAVLFFSIALAVFLLLLAQHLAVEWIRSAEKRVEHWEAVKTQAETTMREMEAKKNNLEKDIQRRKEALDDTKKRLEEMNGLLIRLRDIFNPAERERRKRQLEREIREKEQARNSLRSELSLIESERSSAQSDYNGAKREKEQAESILSGRQAGVMDVKSVAAPWIVMALRTALIIFLLRIIMPYVYGLMGYYILAPIIKRAPPLCIGADDKHVESFVTESRPAIQLTLEPGEEMVAKEEFLQGSEEDLKYSTCFIWKWNYPVTCIVCGLSMLTRVQNIALNQTETRHVTFSHQDDGLLEVCKITVPEGGALVIRPRFISGLVYNRKNNPKIRAVWVFRRLHSWITFQFRYFLIEGPVDVLVAAGRGIQTETLGEGRKPFRANRNRTIAFSPALGYNSIRTETLLGYLRKKNPLFDDYFTGCGVVYKQQSGCGPDGELSAEGAWGKFLSGLGKVFGF